MLGPGWGPTLARVIEEGAPEGDLKFDLCCILHTKCFKLSMCSLKSNNKDLSVLKKHFAKSSRSP